MPPRHTPPGAAARAIRVAIAVLAGSVVAGASRQQTAPPRPPSQVRIDTGVLAGMPSADRRVQVYRGVPYAAPPIGSRRWRPPEPPAPWTGVRDAGTFPAACMQTLVAERKPWTGEFMAHGATSEDCLYLNVWTAAPAETGRRPVFVWLHGGGLIEGSGAVAVYDGESLARKGLVVVTANYRLGVFGYFAHPDLTQESPHRASGNYGYHDQIAVLEWVKRNIAAFGGDPQRVTVAGQSAGAGSVHALSVSPLAKGLFARTIAQSGSGLRRAARPLAAAEQDGVRFAAARRADSLRALRALPASALAPRDAEPRWGAVVDGWLLPDTIDHLLTRGAQHDVPMLTGLTADEGSSAATYRRIPADEFKNHSHEKYGADADAFLALYPAGSDEEASRSQVEAARDERLVSMHLWGALRARASRTPLYTYYWNHAMPGPDRERYGAFHSSEVPYVFDTLHRSNRPWEPLDIAHAETMSSYWTNFVTSGDPNGSQRAPWPAFRAAEPITMELGDRIGRRPVADPARLEFFSKYFAQSAGPTAGADVRRVGLPVRSAIQ